MPKTDSRKKKAAPARPPSEEEEVEEPGARGAELCNLGFGVGFGPGRCLRVSDGEASFVLAALPSYPAAKP